MTQLTAFRSLNRAWVRWPLADKNELADVVPTTKLKRRTQTRARPEARALTRRRDARWSGALRVNS
jgi:hypothetical protein